MDRHGSTGNMAASSGSTAGTAVDDQYANGVNGTNGVNGVHNHATHPEDGTDNADVDGQRRDLESGPPQSGKKSFGLRRKREPLPFKERAMRVTWAWYPCTMSTGSYAVLLANQPFTFTGLTTIGTIVYILNLVLFVTFSLLIGIRFIYKPRAFTTSLHHPSESFFFGAFWVSVALIINGAQGYGGDETGEWFVEAMRVLFWLYFACATVVAVFQYHVIFEVETLSLSEAVPAWILPAYPFLVTGNVAATIAESQSQQSAVQMIVAGIMGQGLGWILAIFIYVVYLTRLINHNMPPPSTRPGMYVSVGPAAYTCAGLLALGEQAETAIPDDFLGITGIPVGEVWRALSVAAALFLWLIAIWFSALTTVSIIREVRRMSFSLQWWAFVFPNVGLALATIQIGEALEADAIKAVGSAITVLLIPLWFLCAFAHIRAIWRRDLLAVGKDLGVEEVNRRHDEKKRAGRWTETEKRNA